MIGCLSFQVIMGKNWESSMST